MRVELRFWQTKLATDLASQGIRSLHMSRNGLDLAILRVTPQLVLFALTLEKAAETTQVPKQLSSFH